jgi:hypothetical protein
MNVVRQNQLPNKVGIRCEDQCIRSVFDGSPGIAGFFNRDQYLCDEPLVLIDEKLFEMD